ncbi:pentapeptide repeat-containing protein [Maridesulfovibrio sp.]|uniref:pentapeptide repeat-containing protein n=1 Tax=Maridesulfovibrio sp. TaxID=2795000 RepID=UPI003AFFDA34
MQHSDFSHADLTHADFSRASMYRAKLHCIVEKDTRWDGASLIMLQGTDKDLEEAENWVHD